MAAEVEIADLAALLMELKDRSRLSYGTLARRLHASPSTLHRYCRGEGLPPEFATLERFARLCKADPEELVELHRRWIAASTARERARERRAPTPERPVAESAASAATAATAEPETPGAPAPPTRPARRRWRLGIGVLATATTLAVAVAAGVLLATRDDGSDTGTASGATGSQPPPTSDEPAPVAVVTRPHAFETPCGNRYLVDADPESVPPPPDEPDAPGWARAMGAVAAEEQYVELTIQGRGDATVVLRDLHVRVTRSGDPLPWNLYAGFSGCGAGPVDTATFDVDLDGTTPRPTPRGGQPELPLWVNETDPLVLYVSAHTAAHDVDWYLELEWSSGDREGLLRIDDAGQPFHTSATSGQREWSFPLGGTDWLSPT